MEYTDRTQNQGGQGHGGKPSQGGQGGKPNQGGGQKGGENDRGGQDQGGREGQGGRQQGGNPKPSGVPNEGRDKPRQSVHGAELPEDQAGLDDDDSDDVEGEGLRRDSGRGEPGRV